MFLRSHSSSSSDINLDAGVAIADDVGEATVYEYNLVNHAPESRLI